LAPTKELAKYVEGLKKGSYSFNWMISGDEAAKQLRFERRFAVIHDQAAEEVRARLARKSTVHIDEMIEYFSSACCARRAARSRSEIATSTRPKPSAVSQAAATAAGAAATATGPLIAREPAGIRPNLVRDHHAVVALARRPLPPTGASLALAGTGGGLAELSHPSSAIAG
jgi:hypothetical protein